VLPVFVLVVGCVLVPVSVVVVGCGVLQLPNTAIKLRIIIIFFIFIVLSVND
jgi:hypothetical protein